MIGKIFGLLVSIGLIVGGATGNMVLRGTNSSEALMVAGVIFLIFDIYSIATHKKSAEKMKRLQQENTAIHAAKYAYAYPGKRKGWAIFWWFLGDFGFLGLHSFYLRKKKVGVLKLTALLALGLLLSIGLKTLRNTASGVGDALMILSSFGIFALFIWNIVDLAIIFRLPKTAFEDKPPVSATDDTV
jgi:hypothetical protein